MAYDPFVIGGTGFPTGGPIGYAGNYASMYGTPGVPRTADQYRAPAMALGQGAFDAGRARMDAGKDNYFANGGTQMSPDQYSAQIAAGAPGTSFAGVQGVGSGAAPQGGGFGSQIGAPAGGQYSSALAGAGQAGMSGIAGQGPAYGGGNPYLEQQGNAIFNRLNDNFTRNTMPAIRGSAMAAGGFGGSRQGVLEANAINDMSRNAGDAYANLMGTDWTNQQNRDLTTRGQDIGNYNTNRQLDQNQTRLGADLFTSGMSGEWNPINQAVGAYQPFTGLGTTTQGTQSGGGAQGLLGGGLSGASFARQMGWI